MPNQLINATSPYLLQHAHNPVDWYPWGPEALEKARREYKPIFLSIGYAACHWCHVMEHESFEDPETARLMNEYFVSIKVDREERPDLDSIYMEAVTAMTGSGGWPMSLFLTPDGKPFYGGTYFPPVRRYGMPSFKEVLASIHRAWEEERGEVDKVAGQLYDHLRQANQAAAVTQGELTQGMLQKAASTLIDSYDWANGGWGPAPKFPQPMAIEFLLQQAARGNADALKVSAHGLHAMSRGGMYDVVGGGFHRYSTDANWLVPHFEKMLYDNAQLALAYLHGYLMTSEPRFRQVALETLDFILREMTSPLGGFFSSLDADSEGVEGKYYLWTMDEIGHIITGVDDFAIFQSAYGLAPEGNFEGKTVLQRQQDDETVARVLNFSLDQVHISLEKSRQKLLAARQERVRPATDDKVLVSWNALALIALSEAARSMRRADYLAAARKNARFLLDHLIEEDGLMRSWRDGQAQHAAYLEDYAALILALLSLYQSDPDPDWYQQAMRLAADMLALYRDDGGAFYSTRSNQSGLLVRPRDVQDNATPSGSSLAAMALLELSAYNEDGGWQDFAEQMLSEVQSLTQQYPTAFGFWLQAMDFAVGPVQQIAMVSPPEDPRLVKLVDYLWQTYRPRTVTATSYVPVPDSAPPLLADRPLKGGAPTVYICEHFTCRMPVNSLQELEKILPASKGSFPGENI